MIYIDQSESSLVTLWRSQFTSYRYPATATEILTCNEIWSVSDTIMRNANTLLTPFWDAVLPPIGAVTPTTEGTSSLASSVVMSRQEAGERERARNEFWSEQDEERDRRREVIRGLWMRVNGVLLAKRGSDVRVNFGNGYTERLIIFFR